MTTMTSLLFVLSMAAVPGAETASASRVSMFLLEPTGVEDAFANALVDAMAAELTQTGALDVLTPADVQRLTSFAAERAETGCDEKNAACLAELGNALGVPYLLSTSVTSIGGGYVAGLTILAVDEAKIVGRETAAPKDGTPAALIDEARRAALRLVAPLLALASGTVVVASSEEGAEVRVDGRLIGTTPLEATEIAAGKHELSVSKDGFVDAKRDVVMPRGGSLAVKATLAPSQETASSWAARAWGSRLAGIGAVTGGVLAGAGAGALFWMNLARADELKRESGGTVAAGEQQVFLARDVGGFTLAGVAILGLGGGALLWLAAGDPNRYAGLVGEASSVTVRDGAVSPRAGP